MKRYSFYTLIYSIIFLCLFLPFLKSAGFNLLTWFHNPLMDYHLQLEKALSPDNLWACHSSYELNLLEQYGNLSYRAEKPETGQTLVLLVTSHPGTLSLLWLVQHQLQSWLPPFAITRDGCIACFQLFLQTHTLSFSLLCVSRDLPVWIIWIGSLTSWLLTGVSQWEAPVGNRAERREWSWRFYLSGLLSARSRCSDNLPYLKYRALPKVALSLPVSPGFW